MPAVYLEDFVRPDHLNGNGTVKYNVNTAYAANAFGAAMRKGVIQGAAPTAGPYGWPSMYGALKSPMYYWGEPVDWTVIGASVIESAVGNSTIYCGDGFRAAGQYTEDEYGLKSQYVPSPFRSGKPDPTGVTVSPWCSPQIDMSGSNGNTIKGLGIYGQPVLNSGSTTVQPTVVPAAGVLVTGLERVQKWPTGHPQAGALHWDGTGGIGGSNNNTFERVNWLGCWRSAGLHLLNAIITTLRDCGISGWYDNSPARLLACTQMPLHPGSVSLIPVQNGSLQSPFYPDLPAPQYRNGYDADLRFLCTPTAAGALVLENTEIHSLIKDTYPSPGQSHVAAPILLHKVRQFSITNRPMGHDGVFGMIEVCNFAYQLSFSGVEFWNADRHGNSLQQGMLYLNECRYPQPGEEQEYGPVMGLYVENCTLNGPVGSGAYIRGRANSAIRNMWWGPTNNIRGDVAILDLNTDWPGPHSQQFLNDATIYAKGSPIRIGGSLPSTVKLFDAGSVQVTGTDNAKRY